MSPVHAVRAPSLGKARAMGVVGARERRVGVRPKGGTTPVPPSSTLGGRRQRGAARHATGAREGAMVADDPEVIIIDACIVWADVKGFC